MGFWDGAYWTELQELPTWAILEYDFIDDFYRNQCFLIKMTGHDEVSAEGHGWYLREDGRVENENPYTLRSLYFGLYKNLCFLVLEMGAGIPPLAEMNYSDFNFEPDLESWNLWIQIMNEIWRRFTSRRQEND